MGKGGGGKNSSKYSSSGYYGNYQSHRPHHRKSDSRGDSRSPARKKSRDDRHRRRRSDSRHRSPSGQRRTSKEPKDSPGYQEYKRQAAAAAEEKQARLQAERLAAELAKGPLGEGSKSALAQHTEQLKTLNANMAALYGSGSSGLPDPNALGQGQIPGQRVQLQQQQQQQQQQPKASGLGPLIPHFPGTPGSSHGADLSAQPGEQSKGWVWTGPGLPPCEAPGQETEDKCISPATLAILQAETGHKIEFGKEAITIDSLKEKLEHLGKAAGGGKALEGFIRRHQQGKTAIPKKIEARVSRAAEVAKSMKY